MILGSKKKKIKNTDDGNDYEIGEAAICILCRDSKGKSDGVVKFTKKKFDKNRWDEHCRGDKHKQLDIMISMKSSSKRVRKKEIQMISFASELGRLAQEIGGHVKGTNITTFIKHNEPT